MKWRRLSKEGKEMIDIIINSILAIINTGLGVYIICNGNNIGFFNMVLLFIAYYQRLLLLKLKGHEDE